MWSCDVEAQRLSGGDSTNDLTMLGGASSPAAAVAVSGGFSSSVSGRGDGLVDGSSRQDGSLDASDATGVAPLVGASPASTFSLNSHCDCGGGDEADSSCDRVQGVCRQSGGTVGGSSSCGRVWGYKGQRVGEVAHPGPELAAEVQELREELAGMRQQLCAQNRQWYLQVCAVCGTAGDATAETASQDAHTGARDETSQ